MVLLFLSELNDYLTTSLKEELFVDTSRGSKLRINFDFVINTISCDCKYNNIVNSDGIKTFLSSALSGCDGLNG